MASFFKNKKIILGLSALILIIFVLFPNQTNACGPLLLDFRCNMNLWASGMVQSIILGIPSAIFTLSGNTFDLVFNKAVLDFSGTYGSISGSIETSWVLIRDVANIAFIFYILYIAAQIVVFGIGNKARSIVTVIAVALLINFSLFFTKLIIDISNIASTSIYNTVIVQQLPENTNGEITMSDAIKKNLGVSWQANDTSELEALNDDWGKMLSIFLVRAIILIAASIVFYMACYSIMKVLWVFIVSIIISPIAFIGFFLPQLKKFKDDWLKKLIDSAIFVPLFLLIFLVALTIANTLSAQFIKGKPLTPGKEFFGGGIGFTEYIFGTIIVLGLFIFSTQAPKKIGGAFGRAAVGASGWLGRNTIGRFGNRLAKSEALDRLRARGGRFGKFAANIGERTGNYLAGSSFDLRATNAGKLADGKAQKGGYSADRKNKIEKKAEIAQRQYGSGASAAVAYAAALKSDLMANYNALGTSNEDILEKRRIREQLGQVNNRVDSILKGEKSKENDGFIKDAEKSDAVSKNIEAEVLEKMMPFWSKKSTEVQFGNQKIRQVVPRAEMEKLRKLIKNLDPNVVRKEIAGVRKAVKQKKANKELAKSISEAGGLSNQQNQGGGSNQGGGGQSGGSNQS